MVEDKYIGLALAVSGSLGIGTSFIITKKVSCHHIVLPGHRTHFAFTGLKRRGSTERWLRIGF